MIKCKALGKSFENHEQLFKALRENKDLILAEKKASHKFKVEGCPVLLNKKTASKSERTEVLSIGDTVKNAINTIYWFDSHQDVHYPKNWNKTAKEQNKRIYHVVNHDLGIGKIVGYPEDVSLSVEKYAWKDLGVDFEGETEVLIGETKISEHTNKDAFMAYRDKKPVQHSPRLRYVNFVLAMNSDDPNDKEEKKEFDLHIDKIANKEEVLKVGFYFGVKEAALVSEFSTVPYGSCPITENLDKDIEPSQDTQKQEAAKALQKATIEIIQILNT